MKEKIKKFLIILVVIAVIGFLGYKIFGEWKQGDLKKEEETQAETKKEQTIRELADKYNALIDWDKNINYTIQLQELLINSNKPILFTGYVDDIFKKDDKYFISFITDWFVAPEIRFILACDYDKISIISNKLKSDTDAQLFNFFEDYAVVANIDDIKKVKLQIAGYPEGEEEITLEYSPADTFIATGECVDFSYIDED